MEKLAMFIKQEISPENAVVCAIPPGGIPVGVETARELCLPFTVLVLPKCQIPWNPKA
jgi:putative phosphoribosyl transferase